MRKQRGFTLVELLIVMTVSVILVSLAAPSFMRMIQGNSIASAANTFMADLRFARSESIRRSGGVVMCRSDSPEADPPACATAVGSSGWASGWVIFHDLNNNGDFDAGETLLRVQSNIPSMDAITESAGSTVFKFTATGRLALAGGTNITFGGSKYATDIKRVMCINAGGRPRIAGDGSATCGSGNQ